MAIIFLVIIFSIFSIQMLARKLHQKHGKRKYHPIGGTVINQLMNFNRLHDYMTDLAGKYRTYRLIGTFRSEIYTSDPDNVEYMLKTNFENYGKGNHNHNILKDFLGNGIFTVDGDKWREQRNVSSYEFWTRVLRDFSCVVFRRNVARLAKVVSEAAVSNEPMDIQDLFMKATLDSIFRVAFGVELDTMCGSNEEGTKFSNAFDDASAMTLWRYVDITWKMKRALGVGSEAKLKKNIKVIDDFVYKLISSKAEKMHESHDDLSLKKEDILSRFLQLNEADPKYLRDIILNFIIAGKDTTATTLSWFVYMLCNHPLVQEKVAKEIENATESDDAAGISEFAASLSQESLEKMHYLHAALTETLRLYPAVPVAGPRICLGKEFAYRQMKIFSAVLLRFFIFELNDERRTVKYRTMINLHIDGGLCVRAYHRVRHAKAPHVNSNSNSNIFYV